MSSTLQPACRASVPILTSPAVLMSASLGLESATLADCTLRKYGPRRRFALIWIKPRRGGASGRRSGGIPEARPDSGSGTMTDADQPSAADRPEDVSDGVSEAALERVLAEAPKGAALLAG